jgi:hypothetical protein
MQRSTATLQNITLSEDNPITGLISYMRNLFFFFFFFINADTNVYIGTSKIIIKP